MNAYENIVLCSASIMNDNMLIELVASYIYYIILLLGIFFLFLRWVFFFPFFGGYFFLFLRLVFFKNESIFFFE
jgi:hypothetical protein